MTGQAPPAIAILVTFLRLWAIVGACLFGSSAIAAEIRADPSNRASAGAILEGAIVPGDFEKVRRYLVDGDGALEIYLASPGGNVAEAMKIGRLLRALKVTTVIPERVLPFQQKTIALRHGLKDFNADYMCASACFFVFVGGIFREADLVGTTPVLGIHRPYLSATDLRGMQADQVIAAAANTKVIVADYLREMSVPSKYLEIMFSVPKDDIRWISNEDFEADFKGFIQELRDWVDAKCGALTADEKKIWSDLKNTARDMETPAEKIMVDALIKKLVAQGNCEDALHSQLALRAWDDALKKGSLSQSK